jgi:hypothetical protein
VKFHKEKILGKILPGRKSFLMKKRWNIIRVSSMAKNKYKTYKNQPKEGKGLKNQLKENKTGLENHENCPFDWKIDDEYYKRQKELRFFCEYTLFLLQMLEASKLTWAEIHKLHNTHSFKVPEVSCRYQEILT